MKLGVMAACFGDRSWEEAVKAAKAAGLEAIEPGVGGFVGKNHCDPEVMLNDDTALKQFVDTASSQGIEISGLSTHGNPLHPDEIYAGEHADDLKNAVALAGKMGIKVVNCFAGCPGAGEGAKYPSWITCPWPPYFGDSKKWRNRRKMPV